MEKKPEPRYSAKGQREGLQKENKGPSLITRGAHSTRTLSDRVGQKCRPGKGLRGHLHSTKNTCLRGPPRELVYLNKEPYVIIRE